MGLTPQQWETIKALFEVAVEKPAAERPSFLVSASHDAVVMREVERLLANHDEAGSFLSSPAAAGAAYGSDGPPSFSPGDLLADRFRVTRFIARGGMGEVYEAEDVELRERVALKSIRTELLRDPNAVDRFRREVHLAKKVTHPNVCRIFDLFRHQVSGAAETKSSQSLLLVAMELLQGETLAERLQRDSRVRTQDALPIAQQMSAGLGAAHDAGRFQNAGEVGKALSGEIAVPSVGRGSFRWIVPAALLLLVVLMLGLRLWRKPTDVNSPPAPAQVVKARPSAAVLPLQNFSGQADTNWVSTALPDMLTAELAAGEKVRAVPGENIARAMADLGLSGKETLSKDSLDHLRQYLGCDYVVLGSYLVQGGGHDQVRLDLWLQDAHSAEILATVSEKGSERELDDLVTRAGADLRQKLGLGEITAGEAASVRASLPSNPDSARLYSEGLAKMHVVLGPAADNVV